MTSIVGASRISAGLYFVRRIEYEPLESPSKNAQKRCQQRANQTRWEREHEQVSSMFSMALSLRMDGDFEGAATKKRP